MGVYEFAEQPFGFVRPVVRVTTQLANINSVVLSWRLAEPGIQYVITCAALGANWSRTVDASDGRVMTDGLDQGKRYRFSITAVKVETGESLSPVHINASTLRYPAVQLIRPSWRADTLEEGGFTLSWNLPARPNPYPVSYYEITVTGTTPRWFDKDGRVWWGGDEINYTGRFAADSSKPQRFLGEEVDYVGHVYSGHFVMDGSKPRFEFVTEGRTRVTVTVTAVFEVLDENGVVVSVVKSASAKTSIATLKSRWDDA